MQEENLDMANKSLEVNTKDLELMKDYVTTTEVSPCVRLQQSYQQLLLALTGGH